MVFSLTKIEKELDKLIKNLKQFCDVFNAYSEGIKYSNQEYTRVGYPILGYFRVQVPENL